MDKVTVYQDQEGGWRWRRQSENGLIVADSGQGYTRKHDATIAAQRENENARVVVVEPDSN